MDNVQNPVHVPIVFLNCWRSCVISWIISSIIIVPNWKQILISHTYIIIIPPILPNRSNKKIHRISIDNNGTLTPFPWNLLHERFQNLKLIFLKHLKIMSKIPTCKWIISYIFYICILFAQYIKLSWFLLT